MKYEDTMKYITIVIITLMLFSVSAAAQTLGQYEDEPTAEELGAPLYPGAVFIRLSTGLDPSYVTAIYISLVPMEMVESFFNEKLVEKRVVYYSDDDTYLTAYLLRTWSKFPSNPTKDELSMLENEPSVQVMYYDPAEYESLAEFFERQPNGKTKAATIRAGKTMIRYTYPKVEGNKSSERIVATWRETSRDLKEYFGSTLTFKEDGTYVFTLTPDNIDALVKRRPLRERFDADSEEALKELIAERNPETGTYVIMRNSFSMESDNPVDGLQRKSGLAKVGPVMLSLRLINKPRMTFIKKHLRPRPESGERPDLRRPARRPDRRRP